MSQQENLIQSRRNRHREYIAQKSKQRLKAIANKKFKTCFIFALAEFEKMFGIDIWGYNLSDDQLTPEQRANRDKWYMVRKNILDKGNIQARALIKEIDLHYIKFEGYNISCGGEKDD